jgi:hypothetical protein
LTVVNAELSRGSVHRRRTFLLDETVIVVRVGKARMRLGGAADDALELGRAEISIVVRVGC